MRYFVTGGAGFIGSNFIRYLLQNRANVRVLNLDALTYAGHLENLEDVKNDPRYTFVEGNICDYDLMLRLMEPGDVVVNFAAETHVDRSLNGLEAEKLFLRTNVEGTMTLLHAAKKRGIARFHQVSTDEVYGDLPLDRPDLRFDEGSFYDPHSPYANSKTAAEVAVKIFNRSYGLDFTISNCTNNYGPYQTPEKMIPRSAMLLLEGKPLKLYTDENGVPGKNVRDWLHVEDHAEAILAILERGRVGETYCIGGDCELSNFQLVEQMLEVMSELTGRNMTIESHVEMVADRPGHDLRYAMNTEKIRWELGWVPKHSFETGFRQTVEWYTSIEGQEWLRALRETANEVREGQDRRRRL